jgi:hypothetical protein
MNWESFDPAGLFEELRRGFPGHDAERMIWAFEQVLAAARIDEHLLDYLLVAAACMIAQTERETPRTVFEQYFRRAVPDDEWRSRYAPLLG